MLTLDEMRYMANRTSDGIMTGERKMGVRIRAPHGVQFTTPVAVTTNPSTGGCIQGAGRRQGSRFRLPSGKVRAVRTSAPWVDIKELP